jgi:hypothetical protein
MHTHGGQQVIVICTYFVLAILYFALAYDWLYRKDYNHFLFNAEILKRQKIAVHSELEMDLRRLHLDLKHLQDLSKCIVRETIYDTNRVSARRSILAIRLSIRFRAH